MVFKLSEVVLLNFFPKLIKNQINALCFILPFIREGRRLLLFLWPVWIQNLERKMPNYSTARGEYKDLGHLCVGTIAFISCYFEPEEFPLNISSKSLGPEPMYSDFLVKQFIECNFGSMI